MKARIGVLAVSLTMTLCAAYAAAQMQLPPGTSSSVDSPQQQQQPKPADPDLSAVQHAEKQMLAQDWPSAIALLRPVIAHAPKNAHAWYDLGFSLEATKDDAGAQTAYESAIAADAAYLAPRASLGLLLARSGDLPAAGTMLRSAVALEGDPNAKAQAYRALARLDLPKAPDRARDDLVAAIKLSSEDPSDIVLTGEIAEALHDDASAEQAYARVLQLEPDNAEAAAQYARVLIAQGKFDQARTALAAGLKQHPNDPALLREQAGLLVREKNFTDAIPALEALHTGKPTDTAITRLLARAYVAAGTPEKADSLFQDLLRNNANDGELMAEWADSLIRQKRNAEAEDVLQKALSAQFATKEARAQAASELAFAASANHHPDLVVRAIAIRNEILPMDATSAFLLATAHDTFHHTREAAGYYRQFLELAKGKYPDEEWQANQRLQTLSRAK